MHNIPSQQNRRKLHALNSTSYKTRQNITRMPCNHRGVKIDIMQNTKTSTRTSLKCMYVMNSTSQNVSKKKSFSGKSKNQLNYEINVFLRQKYKDLKYVNN